jgi:tellurite resistance protein TehA-like permease
VAFTVKKDKRSLNHGITGTWLLAVVAPQSIAVLGTLIAANYNTNYKLILNFIALSMWLWSGMFYLWIIVLIFYRYTFSSFSPNDFAPSYWINMGAIMAISTLAGSLLITNASKFSYLHTLLPFLKGFTLLYWVTGTWWIPFLLVLEFWRHVYKRYPLRYDPLYWGVVFPLGMYSVATFRLAKIVDLPFLIAISQFFIYIAVFAWITVIFGLFRAIINSFR